MNTNRLISALLAPVILAGAALPASASMHRMKAADMPAPFINTSADCYAVGLEVAAREGGELYNAQADTRGGQAVCVIVVVVPQPSGQRPLRKQVIVPR